MGDEARIVSALANLVDNAVTYWDAGSSVPVGARMVDGCVSISVRDRGIGIPGKDLQRIFERFYRVDRARSRTQEERGSGCPSSATWRRITAAMYRFSQWKERARRSPCTLPACSAEFEFTADDTGGER